MEALHLLHGGRHIHAKKIAMHEERADQTLLISSLSGCWFWQPMCHIPVKGWEEFNLRYKRCF